MARFYVLPARPVLGQRFGEFLSHLFPGLSWNPGDWSDLAEALGMAARRHADVYVVYGEDLAEDGSPREVLTRDFGAESGDEVIEVRPGQDLRHWQL